MNELPKIRTELQTKNRGGAPKGNRNALKTGVHSREMRARWAYVRALKRRVKQTLAEINVQLASQGR